MDTRKDDYSHHHDEYQQNRAPKRDGYDSGSDDEDHDEDHHHDTHDRNSSNPAHHHHHGEATLEDGTRLKYNSYHHDPKHGSEPYHIHRVPIFNEGKKEFRSFYHYGNSEHHDEPRGSALFFLNKHPVTEKHNPPSITVKQVKTNASLEHSTIPYQPLSDHDEDHHAQTPSPYAPAFYIPGTPYIPTAPYAPGTPYAPSAPPASTSNHSRLFSQTTQPNKTQPTSEEEKNCCSCLIL